MPQSQAIGRDQLQEYFHLPINEVAKRLGVCATVLKKICRKNGVPRWPHRKIRSLEKMISALEQTVPRSSEDELRIKQEIDTLKSKKEFILENPAVLALQPSAISKKPKKKSKKIKSPLPDEYEEEEHDEAEIQVKLEGPEEPDQFLVQEDTNNANRQPNFHFTLSPNQLLTIQDVMLNSTKFLYNDEIHDAIEEKLEETTEDSSEEPVSFVCSPLSTDVKINV